MRKQTKRMVLSLLVSAVGSFAQDYNYMTNDGAVKIIRYLGDDEAVVIPESIGGLPVVSIGELAFEHNGNLKSAIIPDTVRNIERGAFSNSGLTNIIISGGVTNIANEAFRSCTNLQVVVIPDSVVSVGDFAFDICSGLNSAVIGSGVVNIGTRAFGYCNGLRYLAIPDSVNAIGEDAFYSCKNLTNILLGTGVTSIGQHAFYDCSSLSGIDVSAGNFKYSSIEGVLFDKTGAVLICCPGGKMGGYAVPLGVASIGDEAFSGCAGLTDVVLPDTVTDIGFNAFQSCIGLTEFAIPDSVTNLINAIFWGCTGLTNATVGNGITSLEWTFSGCTNLKSAVIGSNVTSMYGTFGGCSGLTDVVIPDSATNVGDNAFSGCTSLADIEIPNSTVRIGHQAFFRTSLVDIMIPYNVTSIGQYVFSGCSNLVTIAVDELNAFYSSKDGVLFNKDGTVLVCYPPGKAGEYATPSSVTRIGFGAFSSCSALEKMYFRGDKPDLDWSMELSIATNITVYYLPGTAGWSATFGGRPAVLWNPVIQTQDGGFGVRSNGFGFNIAGTNSYSVVVESCINLNDGAWIPVATNTLINGTANFSDSDWTNYPGRFYRLRMP